jgi:hypothetical protein
LTRLTLAGFLFEKENPAARAAGVIFYFVSRAV